MKNNHFFISDEGYTRAKKQLKKSLKNKGVDFSLSQCANLLAKSFGFNDEHHIQQNILEQKKSQAIKNFGHVDSIASPKLNNNSAPNDKNIQQKNVLKPYNRLIQEQKYFGEVQFIWSQAFDFLNKDIFKLTANSNNNEKISYLLKILQEVKITYNFIKQAKVINNQVVLRTEIISKDSNYYYKYHVKKMKYMKDQIIKIYEMTGNHIFKEIALSMYRFQRIESYFYIDLEKRCDYYLQPNDFDCEKYISLMVYYDFSIEDFKNEIKGDIIVFGDSDTNPDILAAIIKKIIGKNNIVQIINIECDVPKEHEIPYKYEMGMKRIYVSYAEDIESLKRYIKRSNPTYDYKDIGLCVKTKLNAKNVSYDFVEIC